MRRLAIRFHMRGAHAVVAASCNACAGMTPAVSSIRAEVTINFASWCSQCGGETEEIDMAIWRGDIGCLIACRSMLYRFLRARR